MEDVVGMFNVMVEDKLTAVVDDDDVVAGLGDNVRVKEENFCLVRWWQWRRVTGQMQTTQK